MKFKIIACIILSITSLSGYTQEKDSVTNIFHLKNGNTIKGEVIEYDTDNNTYRIFRTNGFKSTIHVSQILNIVVNTKKSKKTLKTYRTKTRVSKSSKTAKNNEIGASLYVMSIESKANTWQDNNELTHAGFSGYFSHAHTNHLITRFYIYDANVVEKDKTIVSKSRISGIEAQVIFTTNANQQGWKFFGGLSAFGEKWDTRRSKTSHLLPTRNTHAGLGLTYGLGYNFKNIAIDFSTTVRQKTSYQLSNAQTIASGGLSIAHRF